MTSNKNVFNNSVQVEYPHFESVLSTYIYLLCNQIYLTVSTQDEKVHNSSDAVTNATWSRLTTTPFYVPGTCRHLLLMIAE